MCLQYEKNLKGICSENEIVTVSLQGILAEKRKVKSRSKAIIPMHIYYPQVIDVCNMK